jgi:hypothetical protein
MHSLLLLQGAIWSMLCSFNLTIPRGLRHAPDPKTGAMARSRVLLAAHMRQHCQQVPEALAQNKAVLAADLNGQLRHFSSTPTKLRKTFRSLMIRLTKSLPVGRIKSVGSAGSSEVVAEC